MSGYKKFKDDEAFINSSRIPPFCRLVTIFKRAHIPSHINRYDYQRDSLLPGTLEKIDLDEDFMYHIDKLLIQLRQEIIPCARGKITKMDEFLWKSFNHVNNLSSILLLDYLTIIEKRNDF